MVSKAEIEQLYAQGQTYQEIGKLFGVSRQRIHQILTGYKSPFNNTEKVKRKILVLTVYGKGKPICVRCGFSDIRALSIDHINGGGDRHVKQIGGDLYRWLIKNNHPDGFQTLCMNCQWIKRGENREFRGKRRQV